MLSSLGYTECSQFVGDGVCNTKEGTYISDDGVGVNFNCERFNCDGGDCEICGEDEYAGGGDK